MTKENVFLSFSKEFPNFSTRSQGLMPLTRLKGNWFFVLPSGENGQRCSQKAKTYLKRSHEVKFCSGGNTVTITQSAKSGDELKLGKKK